MGGETRTSYRIRKNLICYDCYAVCEIKIVKMRIIISALIGGGMGFLVGYLGKCTSCTCPLTGNPIISTIIGALLGGLIGAGK